MLKSEKNAIKFNKLITNSNVRFLVFGNRMGKNRNSFCEVFYDAGKVIYKMKELAYIEKERINSNLSTGISEGKIYFAHDYRIDRNCYFGYIMDKPKKDKELICKTVIYNRSNLELQTRIIKNIERIEEIENADDTYIIEAESKTYVVKYLNVFL